MKVAILTDSHDHTLLMLAAARDAKAMGAEAILHCGDVVAPSSLSPLNQLGIPVHVIHGNNTGDLLALSKLTQKPHSQIHYYGQDAGIELHGKRIFLVHYPHYAKAMAITGDWDLVCCGHSHKTTIEHISNIKGGITHYVDAGTVGGVGQAPASWVLADLDSMQFSVHLLDKSLEYQAS